MISELAGTHLRPEDAVSVEAVVSAYYEYKPDPKKAGEAVSFGTSGHRGAALKGTFTESHVAAIAQAVCDYRKAAGITGPCFVGKDTHLLSTEAMKTVLSVLGANGVDVRIDSYDRFVPTPSVSRAILAYNENQPRELADGIVITPSHNPPEQGGIKYNTIIGGPADTKVTKDIERRANEYLANMAAVQRMPETTAYEQAGRYDFQGEYVKSLTEVIDMEALQKAQIPVLIDALGGSGGSYWEAIAKTYGLPLTVKHSGYDPQFSFMTYDHDGVIRMDCSSPYAMKEVIDNIGDFALAVGNDPDFDRYGIVTKEGLMPANHFLSVAVDYLFTHRQWTKDLGIGRTIVVTSLIEALADSMGRQTYEVPVGFKYFSDLLYNRKIGIGGEESAGASFLKKDGTVWTTDKDGMIMGLLAMEIMATTGQSPADAYKALTERLGCNPAYERTDGPCSAEKKASLLSLKPEDLPLSTLGGEDIIECRNRVRHENEALGGLFLRTAHAWVVIRPSGTEALCKLYVESLQGPDALPAIQSDAQVLLKQ